MVAMGCPFNPAGVELAQNATVRHYGRPAYDPESTHVDRHPPLRWDHPKGIASQVRGRPVLKGRPLWALLLLQWGVWGRWQRWVSGGPAQVGARPGAGPMSVSLVRLWTNLVT